jgi:hypothetical protein
MNNIFVDFCKIIIDILKIRWYHYHIATGCKTYAGAVQGIDVNPAEIKRLYGKK